MPVARVELAPQVYHWISWISDPRFRYDTLANDFLDRIRELLVREKGFEPSHHMAPELKSGASANSATPAFSCWFIQKAPARFLKQAVLSLFWTDGTQNYPSSCFCIQNEVVPNFDFT